MGATHKCIMLTIVATLKEKYTSFVLVWDLVPRSIVTTKDHSHTNNTYRRRSR